MSRYHKILVLNRIISVKNKDFISSLNLELENGCSKEENKILSILTNSSLG
jgi:hypothetical protein